MSALGKFGNALCSAKLHRAIQFGIIDWFPVKVLVTFVYNFAVWKHFLLYVVPLQINKNLYALLSSVCQKLEVSREIVLE